MFTLFDLPESYEVPENERNRMFRMVKMFAELPGNDWLNAINWRGVNLMWALGMTQANGVMGCYVFANNTVYLQPEDVYFSGKNSHWPELMVPTLIHELRHKWQFEKNKLVYILCCLPVVREWTIEKDARAVTKEAEEFCSELDRVEAAANYELKQAEKERKKKK